MKEIIDMVAILILKRSGLHPLTDQEAESLRDLIRASIARLFREELDRQLSEALRPNIEAQEELQRQLSVLTDSYDAIVRVFQQHVDTVAWVQSKQWGRPGEDYGTILSRKYFELENDVAAFKGHLDMIDRASQVGELRTLSGPARQAWLSLRHFVADAKSALGQSFVKDDKAPQVDTRIRALEGLSKMKPLYGYQTDTGRVPPKPKPEPEKGVGDDKVSIGGEVTAAELEAILLSKYHGRLIPSVGDAVIAVCGSPYFKSGECGTVTHRHCIESDLYLKVDLASGNSTPLTPVENWRIL